METQSTPTSSPTLKARQHCYYVMTPYHLGSWSQSHKQYFASLERAQEFKRIWGGRIFRVEELIEEV